MTLNWLDLDALVLVENIRLFEMTNDPNRKDGFEGIQRLAQCLKSKLRISWNVMELKLRSTPCRTTGLNLRL